MAILLKTPGEDEARAAEYQAAVERAMRTGAPYPNPPTTSPEEQEYNLGIASRESVYHNFTLGGLRDPMMGGPSPDPKPTERVENVPPMDQIDPSRASYDMGNAAPFTIKGGK